MTLEPKGDPNTQPGQKQPDIILAKWSTRFLAWLIDVIIVSIGAVILFSIVYAPLTLLQGYNNHVPPVLMGPRSAIECLLLFAYWTYFELTSGQSIGKKLLNLRTTNLSGTGIDLKTALIESFGKAFLLPLDILLGWIFTNNRRQRIFNRASNTIVIKLPGNSRDIPKDAKYVKD